MKIAVILSGEPRNIEISSIGIKKAFENYNVKYFVHAWNTITSRGLYHKNDKTEILDELSLYKKFEHIYNTKNIIIDNTKIIFEKDLNIFKQYNPNENLHHLGLGYSIYKACNMALKEQYDYYFIFRHDTYIPAAVATNFVSSRINYYKDCKLKDTMMANNYTLLYGIGMPGSFDWFLDNGAAKKIFNEKYLQGLYEYYLTHYNDENFKWDGIFHLFAECTTIFTIRSMQEKVNCIPTSLHGTGLVRRNMTPDIYKDELIYSKMDRDFSINYFK